VARSNATGRSRMANLAGRRRERSAGIDLSWTARYLTVTSLPKLLRWGGLIRRGVIPIWKERIPITISTGRTGEIEHPALGVDPGDPTASAAGLLPYGSLSRKTAIWFGA
jgi:hypothetical protein